MTGGGRPRGRGVDWAGWAVPGALLLVAAIVIGVAAWPRDPAPPAAAASPSPAHSAQPDPSRPAPPRLDGPAVAVDGAEVRVRVEDGGIVVTSTSDGATTLLGRGEVATAPDGRGGFTPSDPAGFVMRCDGTRGPRHYVFGHLDREEPVDYSGPPATGGSDASGLFVFALDAADAPPSAAITIRAGGTTVSFGADAFATIESDGVRQGSGCWVGGRVAATPTT